jgi:acylphosphatase
MSEIPGHAARLHAIVHGAVQGVGFRFFARRQALGLCLHGYTRNLPDGTVEVVAEGGLAELQSYLEWLQHGPAEAEVQRVDTTWSEAAGAFNDFRVVH